MFLVQGKVDFNAAGLRPIDGRMKDKTGAGVEPFSPYCFRENFAGILLRSVLLLVRHNMLKVASFDLEAPMASHYLISTGTVGKGPYLAHTPHPGYIPGVCHTGVRVGIVGMTAENT